MSLRKTNKSITPEELFTAHHMYTDMINRAVKHNTLNPNIPRLFAQAEEHILNAESIYILEGDYPHFEKLLIEAIDHLNNLREWYKEQLIIAKAKEKAWAELEAHFTFPMDIKASIHSFVPCNPGKGAFEEFIDHDDFVVVDDLQDLRDCCIDYIRETHRPCDVVWWVEHYLGTWGSKTKSASLIAAFLMDVEWEVDGSDINFLRSINASPDLYTYLSNHVRKDQKEKFLKAGKTNA